MSAMEVLTRYSSTAAARMAALVLLALALRFLVVPFALVAVLLDRAQSHITDAVGAIAPRSCSASTEDFLVGGDHR